MNCFPENLDDWRKIVLLIDHSERIFISTHINPDGDAIGSEMALYMFLTRMGKSVRVINNSVTPEIFHFLDPANIIEICKDVETETTLPNNKDMVIFLDLGHYSRTGKCSELLTLSKSKKVIIDHHLPEPVKADVVVVNSSASSTGELVYDLMRHINPSLINEEIAQFVLTAIVTDTGYFRYSNTTATTHEIVSSLYQYGVTAFVIRKHLEKGFPLCRQKLLGLMMGTVRTTDDGKIAYAHITESMFREAGARREHTENLIDFIRVINDVRIAALITQEREDHFKISFRSGNSVSVNTVASMLGGGGHPRAAGASLTGTLEDVTARVLEAAEAHIQNDCKK